MSSIMLPGVGAGLTKENGLITLNFDQTVHAEKRADGIYIPKDGFGQGNDCIIDNWTIKETGKTTDGRTLIDINRDVVPCIFTMSRRKVTNRSSKDDFTTSNETKSANDVMDEFNCVMDVYKANGVAVPEGLPLTQYTLTIGDFLQMRESARPYMAPANSNGDTWPCLMDDINRYQEDHTRVLFYITDVEYQDTTFPKYYMTKLSIRCVWTALPDFIVGQTYTATKS